MKQKLTYITDPGHGWLRIPRPLLNIPVSPCSYQDANYFYLEEDCDMPDFLAANPEIEVNPSTLHLDPCFIRDLMPIVDLRWRSKFAA